MVSSSLSGNQNQEHQTLWHWHTGSPSKKHLILYLLCNIGKSQHAVSPSFHKKIARLIYFVETYSERAPVYEKISRRDASAVIIAAM